MDQESGSSFLGAFVSGSLIRLWSRCQWGSSRLKTCLGENVFPSSLKWLWSGLKSSLPTRWGHQFLAIWGSPEGDWQHGSWLPSGQGKESRCSNRSHSLYVTLVLEVTFHHSVPCSVHRGESLGLAPSRGEGITQTHKYQEGGIIEDHLGRLPQCPSCCFLSF